MPRYSLTFEDIATGASADSYTTIAALICADTAGNQIRIRRVEIHFSDDTPADKNCGFQLKRIADVSAGSSGTATSTVSTANMGKHDPDSADSVASGALDYSAEPTAYETEALEQGESNDRGFWGVNYGDQGPLCKQDQLIAILAAPRDATAKNLSGTIEFETI